MEIIEIYLREELEKLKKLKKRYTRELKRLPEGRIFTRVRDGRQYFYQSRKENEKKCIVGITKNRELVIKLCRKKFLLKAIPQIEKEIGGLKKLLKEEQIYDPLKIIENFSKAYRNIPKETFLFYADDNSFNTVQSKNPFFRENNIHQTGKGIKVKTKSELVIAEKLEKHHIPYEYEAELCVDGKLYYPDFKIIKPLDGKIFFWEHFGKTNDLAYLQKMDRKLYYYRKENIVPWNNLIISYDNEDGSLNTKAIEALITGHLL